MKLESHLTLFEETKLWASDRELTKLFAVKKILGVM